MNEGRGRGGLVTGEGLGRHFFIPGTIFSKPFLKICRALSIGLGDLLLMEWLLAPFFSNLKQGTFIKLKVLNGSFY